MKKLSLVLLTLLAGIAPAQADDDECILQMEALKPVMRENIKNHLVKIYEDTRSISEWGELEDGTRVIYEAGGCAHYSFSFRLENVPDEIPEMPDDPFALALELLAKVPLQDTANLEIIQRSLKEQQEKGFATFQEDKAEFSCGDAFCSLELKPDAITVDYDFAL